LRNAIASNRIAQAYMLTGVRGVGKTTTARILARALNYARPGQPDAPAFDMPELGIHCAQIMESRHPDVIEMDAASNTGVDDVREIIESARYKPMLARMKVFIIDEVHMLSKNAFNALLKTLEEPPGHVKFIFATTEVRKVPVTVLSRCQRFDLRRVEVPTLAAHFKKIVANEGAKATDGALTLIARAAEGSVRDGLSILDQAIAVSAGRGGEVAEADVAAMLGLADRGRIYELAEMLLEGRAGDALKAYAALHADGAEPVQVLTDLAEAMHLVARIKTVGAEAAGDAVPKEEKQRAAALAERLSVALLSRYWQMLLKGIDEAGKAPSPVAAAEMVLIRLAHTADLPSPDEIIRTLGGAGRTRAAANRDASTDVRREPGAVSGEHVATPSGAPTRGAQAAPAGEPAPISCMTALQPAASPAAVRSAPVADDGDPGWSPDADSGDDDEGDPTETPAAPQVVTLESFDAVLDLIGRRRDAKLKLHMEEHVSLVKFDAGGTIELNLLRGAPPELANDLREKLNRWTGRRWMVAVSRETGAPPVGKVRREREAAELARLKEHPAVKAVLDQFPEAEIDEVRSLAHPEGPDWDVGTG
jgi:DNA polymerase-3 subunit gamma/tau